MAAASDLDGLIQVLVAAVAVIVGFFILVRIIKAFLFVCGPHEILVFSGRKQRLADGTVSNYKILHGGRGFRRPFLEVVRRMDMRLFPVEVVVQNAYSRGGIPLTVRAIANVKLANDQGIVRNAIERFLEYPTSQIALAAQQTLEGVLREVVSQLTPEEVNEDRLKFANSLMENAKDDFDQLGLELDVLKVQHVSDDQEYLSNLGRPLIARMLRDAENAENAANQAVTEAKAGARQAAETATKVAETHVVETRNNAAAEMNALEANCLEAENQASMAAETARVRAEQSLQQLRSTLEKLRLHCDVVLPAEANRKAEELKARGEASPAIENGRAAAEALKLVAAKWAEAGDAGRDVYVLSQLQALATAAAERVAGSEVANIKLVAGDERSYAAVLASYPTAVAAVLRETGEALGLDLGRLLATGEANNTARAEAKRRTLPPASAGSAVVGGGRSGPPTRRAFLERPPSGALEAASAKATARPGEEGGGA